MPRVHAWSNVRRRSPWTIARRSPLQRTACAISALTSIPISRVELILTQLDSDINLYHGINKSTAKLRGHFIGRRKTMVESSEQAFVTRDLDVVGAEAVADPHGYFGALRTET